MTGKVTISLPDDLLDELRRVVQPGETRSGIIQSALREYLVTHRAWTDAAIEAGYKAVAAGWDDDDEAWVRGSTI